MYKDDKSAIAHYHGAFNARTFYDWKKRLEKLKQLQKLKELEVLQELESTACLSVVFTCNNTCW